MSGFWQAPDDYAYEPQTFSGAAHSVSGDKEPEDQAAKVRKVAEEVARKPMPKPVVWRMGFY